jgi:MFS superfamily sulfate permease-like transporter
VVLDALGMYDVDYTGTRVLAHALDVLERDGVSLMIARTGEHLRENLARSGLLERIGADHVYASVDEAVAAAGAEPAQSG